MIFSFFGRCFDGQRRFGFPNPTAQPASLKERNGQPAQRWVKGLPRPRTAVLKNRRLPKKRFQMKHLQCTPNTLSDRPLQKRREIIFFR